MDRDAFEINTQLHSSKIKFTFWLLPFAEWLKGIVTSVQQKFFKRVKLYSFLNLCCLIESHIMRSKSWAESLFIPSSAILLKTSMAFTGTTFTHVYPHVIFWFRVRNKHFFLANRVNAVRALHLSDLPFTLTETAIFVTHWAAVRLCKTRKCNTYTKIIMWL